MTHKYNLIVAYTFDKQGIGKEGTLPWHIPKDMAYFKKVTTAKYYQDDKLNVVVMGRKTWDSIPDKFKPLSGRMNIVITGNQDLIDSNGGGYGNKDGITNVVFTSLDSFKAMDLSNYGKVFVIGGESIYKMAIDSGNVEKIYATEIYNYKGECDTFFPQFNSTDIVNVSQFIESNGYWIRNITYNVGYIYRGGEMVWRNEEELAYLNLMKRILETGSSVDDRTGVGTLSCFGEMLKYNLRDTLPISTTKRIPFKFIFEELMLYLRGQTDNKILQNKGIHIWDGNTSREFLDKRGLTHYREGDFGQTYGFNMRHFGGNYEGCDMEYGQETGYDQLANALHLIKNDPASRRIIIDLWDPSTIHKAALPSCLCKYQFNVNVAKKELNLAIYLRSSDYFLANNWNTITGSLFVHLICNMEGIELTPGDLTVFIADAHLYKTHIEQVKKNLERKPYPYPKLIIKKMKKHVTDFEFTDLELLGYKAHPGIKAEMAV
jgi:dihydrofolate reductase/thymidylate synthase